MKFCIEYIATKARPAYVFARQLVPGDFALHQSPCLGDVPIRQSVTQPRALTPQGDPDLTIFAFTLVTANDLSKFSVGQVVELSNAS